MLDRHARTLIDGPLNRLGQGLARAGMTANTVTLIGLALGLIAAATIALGHPGWALIPLLASRLADGLDGAVARATRQSDYGGYLDIACDFLFYGAIPFGFVLLDVSANGVAGAFLLTSFYFNAASFLGFAINYSCLFRDLSHDSHVNSWHDVTMSRREKENPFRGFFSSL